MSNYTKATNFAVKDGVPSGTPSKLLKGTELDTEFNNIQVAVATKQDTTTSLTSLATIGSAADKMAYTTATSTWAETAITAVARTYLALTTTAAMLANIGAAAVGNVPVDTHAATAKAVPADADELALVDSAASFGLKKFTWANIKTALALIFGSLNIAQTWTAAQRGTISTLTYGATVTPDFSLANLYTIALTGNFTLANPTNLVAGQSGSIFITQDPTGSRLISYGSAFKFSGGVIPALTTTINAVDRLDYVVKSATEIHAALSKDVK